MDGTYVTARQPRRWHRYTAVVGAVIAAVMLLTGVANASTTNPGNADFTAQGREAGLTDSQAKTLQAEVNGYLAKMGGTQVAANKIRLPGADIVLPLPGEKRARALTASGGVTASYACNDGHLCVYRDNNFSGPVIDMYYCGIYGMPWATVGSWFDNQIPGTRSDFLYADYTIKDSVWAFNWGYLYDWTPISWIRAC